jgi:hypothetical protein
MECMRHAIFCATVLVLLCPLAANAGGDAAIPDAPSSLLPTNAALKVTATPSSFHASPLSAEHAGVIDKQFLILSAISTATIFADSYTTTWIGQNYRAHGSGPCTVEGGEPLLYGLHPTAGRAYAVGAAMAAGAITASYLAKKHLPSKLKWMWPAPLLYETGVSVHGFSTNLVRCNP